MKHFITSGPGLTNQSYIVSVYFGKVAGYLLYKMKIFSLEVRNEFMINGQTHVIY